jgi:RNA polymerase primary sigma factor
MDPVEERALARRVRAGDRKARETLIVANARLVYWAARRYRPRGVPLADAIQEGMVGLIVAIDGFDWRRGCRLSTYALWKIRERIRRHCLQPQSLSSLQGPAVVSIDRELGDGEQTLSALVADSFDTCEDLSARLEREALGAALRSLPPRTRDVLTLRYGLDGGVPCSQSEIGRRLGLSRQRVQQVEQSGLKLLGRTSELAQALGRASRGVRGGLRSLSPLSCIEILRNTVFGSVSGGAGATAVAVTAVVTCVPTLHIAPSIPHPPPTFALTQPAAVVDQPRSAEAPPPEALPGSPVLTVAAHSVVSPVEALPTVRGSDEEDAASVPLHFTVPTSALPAPASAVAAPPSSVTAGASSLPVASSGTPPPASAPAPSAPAPVVSAVHSPLPAPAGQAPGGKPAPPPADPPPAPASDESAPTGDQLLGADPAAPAADPADPAAETGDPAAEGDATATGTDPATPAAGTETTDSAAPVPASGSDPAAPPLGNPASPAAPPADPGTVDPPATDPPAADPTAPPSDPEAADPQSGEPDPAVPPAGDPPPTGDQSSATSGAPPAGQTPATQPGASSGVEHPTASEKPAAQPSASGSVVTTTAGTPPEAPSA